MDTRQALYGGFSEDAAGVLNPTLFSRMERVFSRVGVHKPREPLITTTAWRTAQESEEIVIAHGEQYKVNCPFCKDTRTRLYVNHTYGQPDDAGRLRYIARCYNEDCLKQEEHREALKQLLTAFINLPNRKSMAIRPMAAAWSSPVERGRPELPEDVIPLVDLHAMIPNHVAISYMLQERWYSWDMIRQYNVLYCFRSQKWPTATNRIIFPCYASGELYGWQARYIGKPYHKRIPKYFNLPGMQKESHFYNWDVAKTGPALVITEGVPAVHFLGNMAVATLGKTVSPLQFTLLQAFRGKPIVLWFDIDAQDKIPYLRELFAQRGLSFVNIPPIDPDKDPADYGYAESWRIIRYYCDAAGVSI